MDIELEPLTPATPIPPGIKVPRSMYVSVVFFQAWTMYHETFLNKTQSGRFALARPHYLLLVAIIAHSQVRMCGSGTSDSEPWNSCSLRELLKCQRQYFLTHENRLLSLLHVIIQFVSTSLISQEQIHTRRIFSML